MYGVQYGHQKHDVYLNFDLSHFDPESEFLRGVKADTSYLMRFNYINQRLMLGYAHRLPQGMMKGWVGESRAGIAIRVYSKGLGDMPYGQIIYPADTGNRIYFSEFARMRIKMGNVNNHGNKWSWRSKENSFYHTFEAYIGVRKDLNKWHLKTLSVGLEGTWTAYNEGNIDEYIMVMSMKRGLIYTSTDSYKNRNISLGLRVGVGLW